MKVENITDDYGNKRTLINMMDDGIKAHLAIPHQRNNESTATKELYGVEITKVNIKRII